MMRIFPWGLAAFMLLSIFTFPGNPAAADEPEVIKRLRGEKVSVFDAGMKRLRQAALTASGRLSSAAQPGPRVGVRYDDKTGIIEIEFLFTDPNGNAVVYSKDRCMEMHKTAIRETFNIGRTIYAVPLTFEERVRRRLGLLFSHEPIQNVKEVVALGQRLSQLTFLRVEIVGRKNIRIASCRGRVAPEVGGQ